MDPDSSCVINPTFSWTAYFVSFQAFRRCSSVKMIVGWHGRATDTLLSMEWVTMPALEDLHLPFFALFATENECYVAKSDEMIAK